MKGKCLCGSVTIVAPSRRQVGGCHCDACRRWGGGPAFAIECGSDVEIHGREHVESYRSSDWAERGFCRRCGTHLYYRYLPRSTYAIPAGIFGDVEGLELSHQLFIDRKPPYYALANETATLSHDEAMSAIRKDRADAAAEPKQGDGPGAG